MSASEDATEITAVVTAVVTDFPTPELLRLKATIIDDLHDYLELGGAEDEEDPAYDPDFDAGYDEDDIDRCEEILDHFLAALAEHDADDATAVAEAVRSAVLALNELNDLCDSAMIETDQREQLCDFFARAVRAVGLEADEDVTEFWRDW
jgi:hypothetical protein